jgi:ferredoxin-NADP reductase
MALPSMQKEVTRRVIEVIPRTYNVKSIRVGDPGDVPYTAGQFMTVSLGEGREWMHYLTISSSPTEKGFVEFTKKITESPFSRKLDRVAPGDTVAVKYPFGTFTLKGDAKVAFLSGGIGITPIRSICRFATDEKLPVDIAVLYGNRAARDVVFKDDFDAMQKENPALHVAYTFSSPEGAEETKCGRTGYIDAAMITDVVPDYRERVFYICGPPAMVESLIGVLRDTLGMGKDKIIRENFTGY